MTALEDEHVSCSHSSLVHDPKTGEPCVSGENPNPALSPIFNNGVGVGDRTTSTMWLLGGEQQSQMPEKGQTGKLGMAAGTDLLLYAIQPKRHCDMDIIRWTGKLAWHSNRRAWHGGTMTDGTDMPLRDRTASSPGNPRTDRNLYSNWT